MTIHGIGRKFTDEECRDGIYIEHDTDAEKVTIMSSFDGGQCRDTYQWTANDFVQRLGLSEQHNDAQIKESVFSMIMDFAHRYAENQGHFLAYGNMQLNEEFGKIQDVLESVASKLVNIGIFNNTQIHEMFLMIDSEKTKAYCSAAEEIKQLKKSRIDEDS